jgi:hypothetical protein
LNIPASDSRARAVADSQFGGGATPWAPATWYVGVSTTFSNRDGSNFTEPVGNAYVRIAKTNNVTNFPAATTVSEVTTKRNGTKITWPDPTGTWGPIVEIGYFLAASGGTPEWKFKPPTPITVQSGNTPVEIDVNQGVMRFGPSGS